MRGPWRRETTMLVYLGVVEMVIFVSILAVELIYAWMKGALK
jgi:NADH:ubiquinone oxidoreductase subunit 3 (subunit A)